MILFRTHYKRLIEYYINFFDRLAPFCAKKNKTNISLWLTVDLKNEVDCRDVVQQLFRKSKTTKN